MNNFALEEVFNRFKRGILWLIVTVIFSTRELKNEAFNHFHTGVVLIPGVCYGCNLVKGYQAIGKLFPQRRTVIRLDFILGYVKILLIIASFCGLFIMAAQYFS